MPKLSRSGYQEQTFVEICSDLRTCFALVLRANLRLCNALLPRTSQAELPKSQTPHLSVVAGRPISESSRTAGSSEKAAGRCARLTAVK